MGTGLVKVSYTQHTTYNVQGVAHRDPSVLHDTVGAVEGEAGAEVTERVSCDEAEQSRLRVDVGTSGEWFTRRQAQGLGPGSREQGGAGVRAGVGGGRGRGRGRGRGFPPGVCWLPPSSTLSSIYSPAFITSLRRWNAGSQYAWTSTKTPVGSRLPLAND